MIYAIVSHPVQDFEVWKPVFDGDSARATNAGIVIVKLLRGLENPNLVTIVCTAPSLEGFNAFFHDPILPELMKNGGVLAPPTVEIFTEA
ncbi:MAG: hypothetical protein ACKVT2_03180 [Saprospiraceae bacterium]